MTQMDVRQIAAIAVALVLMGVWFVTLPDPPTQEQVAAERALARDGADGDRDANDAATRRAPLTQIPELRHDELAPPESLGEPIEPFAAREMGGGSTRTAGAGAESETGELIELENDALHVAVDSRGARIRSLTLAGYQDRVGRGAEPVELVTLSARGLAVVRIDGIPLENADQLAHEVVERSSRRVRLRLDRGGVEIVRELEIDSEGYGGWLRTTVLNRSGAPIRPRFLLEFYGYEDPARDPRVFHDYSAVVSEQDGPSRSLVLGIESPGFLGDLFGGGGGEPVEYPAPVEWVGFDSRYFLTAALPEDPAKSRGFTSPIGRNAALAAAVYPAFEVPPGHKLERAYRLYLGPKTRPSVDAVDPRLGVALDVGWSVVRPLVNLFDSALIWTYQNVIHNYGAAIILLTIVLRLATFPLTQRSMKSMRRFAEIAPEIKAVQERHDGDREKMQAELMSLYKQKGMNPFTAMGGGCLPMLIQMPFLLALYFALQGSIELRHAPFIFWIQDLSTPENFLSLFGVPVRPLPLLMGGSMILQQWLTPSSGDAQQKQMMMWMSLVFTFMFYQFASGLVLYWFVSNLLGIGQQLLVNRGSPAPAQAS